MSVSQSNTMWVKKGTVVNGKKVKKGYVAQKGKAEKRVTNKINLVVDTDKRGKAGETVQTKKGRYVKSTKTIKVDKPLSKGGGYTGNGRPSTPPKTNPPETDPPKDTPKGDRTATSATVSSALNQTPYKSDRAATSATVSAAQKTEPPRSVASVKGFIDNYKSARRESRANIQNSTRPIKIFAKDIKTKAQARAVLASKNASSSLKAAARRVIEGK